MIFVSIILAAAGAVVLSEALGRGTVVYTRLLTLGASYVACCVAAVWVTGGGALELIAIVLSGVPLMAAWVGFRIHLSNSITLEMADLMADGRARTAEQLAADYGTDEHTATRMAILRQAGYLREDPQGGIEDSPKSRAVLQLMRLLCGPAGPPSVAASLKARRLR